MKASGHIIEEDSFLRLSNEGRPLLNFILGKLLA